MSKLSIKANLKDSGCLILASGSPRRTQLLSEHNIEHEVVIPNTEELLFHNDGPLALVKENAKRKAYEISQKFSDRWVLGADTIVSLGDRIFGKPGNLAEAEEMLLDLGGKTHLVSTGVCLAFNENQYLEVRVESSDVCFKDLSKDQIATYFNHVNPLDKAGAYGIQTKPEMIINEFHGSRSNVIGLPMELVIPWISEVNAGFTS